jgi:hypothetical protein
MTTGPHTLLGLEINEYAAELARVTVWIGDLQWSRRNGYKHAENPILQPLDGIEHRDALLNVLDSRLRGNDEGGRGNDDVGRGNDDVGRGVNSPPVEGCPKGGVNSPPVEGCPKGGVVARHKSHAVPSRDHPVRLRLPHLQGRGILCRSSSTGGEFSFTHPASSLSGTGLSFVLSSTT